GHPAGVSGVPVHDELEDLGPGRDEAVGLAAVGLLEAIHEEDLLPERGVREVDDHLHPLGWRDADALDGHGVLGEVTIRADRDEGLPVAQEELVDASIRTVEETEAILAPGDPEERMDDNVDEELVTEE